MMKLNVDLSYQMLALSRGKPGEIQINEKTDQIKIIITPLFRCAAPRIYI